MSWGVGRIRKGPHPRLEGGLVGVELDASEKVSSGARDPGIRDGATGFERIRFITQVVDDEIEYLWWKGGRHHGFVPNR